MAITVSPDSVAGIANAPHRIGEVARHFADDEVGRLYAFVFEYVQHLGRAGRQRTVVEGDHDLMIFQRQGLVILHGAETRVLGGIDHKCPARAERVGVARAFGGSFTRLSAKNPPAYGTPHPMRPIET